MMRTCNVLNVHTMIAGRRSAINISMPELSSISRDKEKLLFRITRNEIFSVTIRCRSHVCFYDDGSVGEKVQSYAEARVAHICRSTGRQESEHLLGTSLGQYRRLISTCAVRAQAMCILARVPALGKEIQVVIVKMPIFLSICNCLVL